MSLSSYGLYLYPVNSNVELRNSLEFFDFCCSVILFIFGPGSGWSGLCSVQLITKYLIIFSRIFFPARSTISSSLDDECFARLSSDAVLHLEDIYSSKGCLSLGFCLFIGWMSTTRTHHFTSLGSYLVRKRIYPSVIGWNIFKPGRDDSPCLKRKLKSPRIPVTLTAAATTKSIQLKISLAGKRCAVPMGWVSIFGPLWTPLISSVVSRCHISNYWSLVSCDRSSIAVEPVHEA